MCTKLFLQFSLDACVVFILLLDIGEATGMTADDVIATLVSLDMITERDSRFVGLPHCVTTLCQKTRQLWQAVVSTSTD